ncbi:MAG: hypothetical protein M3346_05115, partial [Actinomycetota bacterium]|nr:hypothetical protein [Actinomycetota bacterium]
MTPVYYAGPEFGELRQARLPREPLGCGFIAKRQAAALCGRPPTCDAGSLMWKKRSLVLCCVQARGGSWPIEVIRQRSDRTRT